MATVAPRHTTPDPPDAFHQEVRDLVAATAPRVFAVVEEFTEPGGEPDAHVLAWGMAHANGCSDVTATAGGLRMSLASPERAAHWFSRLTDGSVRLVWPRTANTT